MKHVTKHSKQIVDLQDMSCTCVSGSNDLRPCGEFLAIIFSRCRTLYYMLVERTIFSFIDHFTRKTLVSPSFSRFRDLFIGFVLLIGYLRHANVCVSLLWPRNDSLSLSTKFNNAKTICARLVNMLISIQSSGKFSAAVYTEYCQYPPRNIQ